MTTTATTARFVQTPQRQDWTEPLNYPGRCEDIVGQVVGPTHMNEHYIISEAHYRSDMDITECRLTLMAKGTEKHVPLDAQVDYMQQRISGMIEMLGYNPRNDLLPFALRKDQAPAVPRPRSIEERLIMPGTAGRDLALGLG